jgi:hypothetical protein
MAATTSLGAVDMSTTEVEQIKAVRNKYISYHLHSTHHTGQGIINTNNFSLISPKLFMLFLYLVY